LQIFAHAIPVPWKRSYTWLERTAILNSGITYDSYATAVEKNHKIDQAIQMQKKAVTIATLNNDELLETFQKNLEAKK